MMGSRIPTLSIGCLIAGLALAGAVTAQVRVEEKVNVAVTGEITEIDVAARKLTVKGSNDDGLVYVVADTATILSGSKKLELGELVKGWSVVMNGHDDGETKPVTYVKVVKAP